MQASKVAQHCLGSLPTFPDGFTWPRLCVEAFLVKFQRFLGEVQDSAQDFLETLFDGIGALEEETALGVEV